MATNEELKNRYAGGQNILEILVNDIDNDLGSHKPEDVDNWSKEQWLEFINRHMNRWYKWCSKRLDKTLQILEMEEEIDEIKILRFTKTPNHNDVLVKYGNDTIGEVSLSMLKHFINRDDRDFLEVIKNESKRTNSNSSDAESRAGSEI